MRDKFIEILKEAGLAAGVFNFIPGSGAEVGDSRKFAVSHPQVPVM